MNMGLPLLGLSSLFGYEHNAHTRKSILVYKNELQK